MILEIVYGILAISIAAMVALMIVGSFNEVLVTDTQSSNFTATVQNKMLNLLPSPIMLVILVILGVVLTLVLKSSSADGLMQAEIVNEDKEEPEQKQTYEEFVRERLKVEEMMR